MRLAAILEGRWLLVNGRTTTSQNRMTGIGRDYDTRRHSSDGGAIVRRNRDNCHGCGDWRKTKQDGIDNFVDRAREGKSVRARIDRGQRSLLSYR